MKHDIDLFREAMNDDPLKADALEVELRALAATSYDAYQRTEYWAMVRRAVRRRDGRCVSCGGSEKLRVHHTDYSVLGQEWRSLAGVVVLCDDCHARVHGRIRNDLTPIVLLLGGTVAVLEATAVQ